VKRSDSNLHEKRISSIITWLCFECSPFHGHNGRFWSSVLSYALYLVAGLWPLDFILRTGCRGWRAGMVWLFKGTPGIRPLPGGLALSPRSTWFGKQPSAEKGAMSIEIGLRP
jgi:hypothetical protein